jgi:CBS domain-containing protein
MDGRAPRPGGTMLVKDIMTVDPVCCTPDTKLEKAAQLMLEYDCGAIPVVKDFNDHQPVGIVTDRDIVCRIIATGRNPADATVRDCMSLSCVTIAPEASIDDCCKVMEAYQVRRVLVVDEHGQCCGLVAQADIAAAAPQEEVAEVVREISQPAFTSTETSEAEVEHVQR